MKNVRHKPDLSTWSLPLSHEISSALEKAISSTVESVLELAFEIDAAIAKGTGE